MKEPILANQKMSTLPFAGHCARVEALLNADYGIVVITRDIPDPLTGDLDGLEIHIDYSVTAEQRLFLLAHLFGHTFQRLAHLFDQAGNGEHFLVERNFRVGNFESHASHLTLQKIERFVIAEQAANLRQ